MHHTRTHAALLALRCGQHRMYRSYADPVLKTTRSLSHSLITRPNMRWSEDRTPHAAAFGNRRHCHAPYRP
jgi:hypothetical protein